MQNLLQHICASLADGQDLVLATVSSRSGSTPRLAGAKMIIFRDGRISGSIGGGLVEAKAMEEANICFASGQFRHRAFDIDNGAAATADMICGGRLEFILEYIGADEANRRIFHDLLTAVQSGRRVVLVSRLIDGNGPSCRFVVDHQGAANRNDIAESLLAAIKQVKPSTATSARIEHQGQSYLLSFFAAPGTVYLVGAGHVAVCTAEVAARVGFRVVVMDDRPEFANRERFPEADAIRALPSFAACFQGFEVNNDSYLVIVTRGHLHDMEVLYQALQTKAGYIGMIGSRTKRDAIYAKLMDRGVSRQRLERVRCPIGMAIAADTPEEIAVSIVGELIQRRATGRRA
ncbi:MAG: XdhC/CoxI family protein [Desulfobulbaceae bacterium]|nr:XdhC/CoxI family protein [Desulfobulbaceae bacterium]